MDDKELRAICDVLVNADLEYCQRVLAERRGEE
jgi:hypothetical protein